MKTVFECESRDLPALRELRKGLPPCRRCAELSNPKLICWFCALGLALWYVANKKRKLNEEKVAGLCNTLQPASNLKLPRNSE